MADVVEIIAKALCADDGFDWEQIVESSTNGIDDAQGRFRESAQACLTALHNAGLVILPKEPTEAMIEAAGGSVVNLERADDPSYEPADIYRAMIEASQK